MLPMPQAVSVQDSISREIKEEDIQTCFSAQSPIEEAKKIATQELAVLLFELSDPDEYKTQKIQKELLTAILVSPGIDRDKVIFHLSQAVNSMSNNIETQVEMNF